MKQFKLIIVVWLCLGLSGCVVYTVAETAVDATTTVIGGAIGVVDAVTPDVFDDEDEDNDEENKDEE